MLYLAKPAVSWYSAKCSSLIPAAKTGEVVVLD